MSLSKSLQKGVRLKGLATLLNGGGAVGGDDAQVSRRVLLGSYTVSGLIWKDITFHAVGQGKHSVNILPYEQGAINYAQAQGRETISGELTGCTMAVYTYNGSTRVGHVDTARDSESNAPGKAHWELIKQESCCRLISETPTAGMIPAFLEKIPAEKLTAYARLSVLGVADSTGNIKSV